jgi:hypothetical protein
MRGALSAFPLFGIIADALEVRQTADGDGGWWGLFRTVPGLLFEKKGLIPAIQELLVSYQKS